MRSSGETFPISAQAHLRRSVDMDPADGLRRCAGGAGIVGDGEADRVSARLGEGMADTRTIDRGAVAKVPVPACQLAVPIDRPATVEGYSVTRADAAIRPGRRRGRAVDMERPSRGPAAVGEAGAVVGGQHHIVDSRIAEDMGDLCSRSLAAIAEIPFEALDPAIGIAGTRGVKPYRLAETGASGHRDHRRWRRIDRHRRRRLGAAVGQAGIIGDIQLDLVDAAVAIAVPRHYAGPPGTVAEVPLVPADRAIWIGRAGAV